MRRPHVIFVCNSSTQQSRPHCLLAEWQHIFVLHLFVAQWQQHAIAPGRNVSQQKHMSSMPCKKTCLAAHVVHRRVCIWLSCLAVHATTCGMSTILTLMTSCQTCAKPFCQKGNTGCIAHESLPQLCLHPVLSNCKVHSSLTGSHDHILLQGQILISLTVKSAQLAYTMCEDMLEATYSTIFDAVLVCTDLSACTLARQTR